MKVKALKTAYRKHGLDYELLRRKNQVALFEISHCYKNEKVVDGYEVFIIPVRKPWKHNDQYCEALPTDSEFGRLYKSKAFYTIEKALQYFQKLGQSER